MANADYSLMSQGGPFQAVDGFRINWNYTNTAHSLAQMQSSGYFNVTGAYVGNYRNVNLYDSILVTASDGSALLVVTDTDPDTTTILSATTTALANGDIFVGNASNLATAVSMSGDATIINTGALTIANSAITTVKINDSAVTTAKINNNAVTSAKLNAAVLQYATATVTSANLTGMYAAPVQVLAAAGANTLIVVESVALAYTYLTSTYTGGGVIGLQYGNTIHLGGNAATGTTSETLLTLVGENVVQKLTGTQTQVSLSTDANSGIFISNATAAFSAAGTRGSIVAHIWYRVIPTA